MRRYYIVEGDKTTVGGVVQKHTGAGSNTTWHGKTVNNIDDKIDCPACKSIGIIQPVGDRHPFGNRGFIPALNDDICICKCSPPPKLIHSQMVFYQDVSEVENQDWLVSNARPSHDDNASHDNSPLRKFHVHFRRPDNYKGEFGFDWLRDEYLYDTNGQTRIYQGTDKFLIEEYRTFKKQPVSELEQVEKYDDPYIPAWLAIFENQTAVLNLQIDMAVSDSEIELDKNDNTNLIFECSEGITIDKSSISLSEFLTNAEKQKEIFTSEISRPNKEFLRYLNKSFSINIVCSHDFHALGWIKIFAKKNTEKKQVGLLSLYPNSQIKIATIQPVFFVTHANVSTTIHPDNYQTAIKQTFFNQALVSANIEDELTFNLIDKKIYIGQNDSQPITSNYKIETINQFLREYQPSMAINDDKADSFLSNIINLCNILVEKQDVHTTYLIFTDYDVQSITNKELTTTLGMTEEHKATSAESQMCQIERRCNNWGNHAVIFNEKRIHTTLHELGHSFGLSHTFQDISTGFIFREGSTDNIMDYTIEKVKTNRQICLSKWQWDIINHDINLK